MTMEIGKIEQPGRLDIHGERMAELTRLRAERDTLKEMCQKFEESSGMAIAENAALTAKLEEAKGLMKQAYWEEWEKHGSLRTPTFTAIRQWLEGQ